MQKRRLSFKFIALLAVIFGAVAAVLLSPLFRIKEIDVYGNFVITKAEILSAAQIEEGMNIFSFSSYAAARRVDALPYARSVVIERHLPDRIVIQVVERVAIANISVAGSSTYLLIDDAGMVLRTGQTPAVHLPKIIGLNFLGFSVGEYLQVDSAGVFEDIVFLADIFAVYDFFPDVVDFSNPRDIVMYYENFEIDFGNMEEAQRKVRYLKGITDEPPHGMDRGIIDIRDVNNHPRFRLSR